MSQENTTPQNLVLPKQSAVSCRVCLEPIESFFCSACMFEQVYGWLKSRYARMVPFFIAMQENMTRMFPYEKSNWDTCDLCTNNSFNSFCAPCYYREVYYAIAHFDEYAGKEMLELFNFDFDKINYDEEHKVVHIPMRFRNLDYSFIEGYCEICTKYSGYLVNDEGIILCANCVVTG